MTHETRCNLIDALTAAGSTRSNYDLARQFGCDVSTVRAYRKSLGVPVFARKLYDWSTADLSKTAREVAADVGCSIHAVHSHRTKRRGPWTPEQNAAILSRTKPDDELAADFGRTKAAIRHHRWRLRRGPP
jgi:DNA-binding CsgD family transcriptional regulator